MKIDPKHSWDVSVQEAREIQSRLAGQIVTDKSINFKKVKTIGAADISFARGNSSIYASLIVVNYPDLKLLDVYSIKTTTSFPYIPGYLSFREIPPLLEIIEKLKSLPDIMLCDGQGLAHPRGMGLASHLGLVLDIPTVGCAKSLLVGDFEDLPEEKGSFRSLMYQNKEIGVALRTRESVKPLFVSIGHKITLGDAIKIVMECCTRYRIPDPLRMAHKCVNIYRRTDKVSGPS
jgi:deoxyribonuclease V